MIRWLFRLVVFAAVVYVGLWSWHKLFPGPEEAIRKRLVAVAKAVSVSPDQGLVPKATSLTTLRSYFTDDVEVTVNIPGQRQQVLQGSEEVMQVAGGIKMTVHNLKVEIIDADISLASSQSALAHLTIKLDTPGQNTMEVQPLKVGLKYIDGDWLIHRIETEKVLR
jgi:hypothetical protein